MRKFIFFVLLLITVSSVAAGNEKEEATYLVSATIQIPEVGSVIVINYNDSYRPAPRVATSLTIVGKTITSIRLNKKGKVIKSMQNGKPLPKKEAQELKEKIYAASMR